MTVEQSRADEGAIQSSASTEAGHGEKGAALRFLTGRCLHHELVCLMFARSASSKLSRSPCDRFAACDRQPLHTLLSRSRTQRQEQARR